jgi:hypothetical protein
MRNLIIVFGTEKVIVITRVIIVRIMKCLVVVLVLVILLGGQNMSVVRWQIGNYKNKTCVNANNCNQMNESEQ